MVRIVLFSVFVGIAGLAGLQTYFGDKGFDDFGFSPNRRKPKPAATASATVTATASPSPSATEASPDLSEGEKLLSQATESLEGKDYAKAISGAQQACDFFGKSPASADKLKEAEVLKRKANLAWADDKLKQASELLEQRKFRTAQSTAKEAEVLYTEHAGPKESQEQAVALQHEAQEKLNAARHRQLTPSATPYASATPGASGTPYASATPGASGTPHASATPGDSGTPYASATPHVSATPGASATPTHNRNR